LFCEVVFDASVDGSDFVFAARITLCGLTKKDIEDQLTVLKKKYLITSVNYIS
jgi:hypothetical protein